MFRCIYISDGNFNPKNELENLNINDFIEFRPIDRIYDLIPNISPFSNEHQSLDNHIQALEYVYENFDDEFFLICKEKFKVIKSIDLNSIVDSINWDVLFLGGLNHYHIPSILNKNYLRLSYSFNNHFYLIKRKYIPKVLDKLSQRDFECDVIFAKIQESKHGDWVSTKDNLVIPFNDKLNYITCEPGNEIILPNLELKVSNFVNNNTPYRIKNDTNLDKKAFLKICEVLLKRLSNNYPLIDKKSKNKSLIVETRFENLEFTVKNTIQKLGNGWGHIIYCSNENLDFIKSFCNKISEEIEIRVLDKVINTRNDYNNLLLDLEFWNQIDCEKVLIYQTDSFLFREFDIDFLKLNLVGSRWNKEHQDYISKQLNLDSIYGCNGGLSLRSVSLVKDTLSKNKKLKNIFEEDDCDYLPEDLFYSYYLNNLKAEISDCDEFSYEYISNNFSFGTHCPWRSNFDTFIERVDVFGVNLFGFLNSTIGLGRSARNLYDMLIKLDIPVNAYNLRSTDNHNYVDNNNETYYNTNLFFCNPDWSFDFNDDVYEGKYNIGYWFWELEKIPEYWKKVAEKLDEIWVATSFIKEIFEKELPDKKIKLIPNSFEDIEILDKNICREKFDFIQNDDFVFLFTFDFKSDFYRKNPISVIESFNYLDIDNSKLIIKCQDGDFFPEEKEKLFSYKSNKITIIDEVYDENKLSELFNICDVYISLHSSEGLGLTIVESILREKPTISTNYSGNLDFCKGIDELLVSYTTTSTIPKNSVYIRMMDGVDVRWVEPDIQDAVSKMRYVFNNYQHCVSLTKKCKEYINKEYSFDKCLSKLDDVLKEIESNEKINNRK